jgi:hypothetical protein
MGIHIGPGGGFLLDLGDEDVCVLYWDRGFYFIAGGDKGKGRDIDERLFHDGY